MGDNGDNLSNTAREQKEAQTAMAVAEMAAAEEQAAKAAAASRPPAAPAISSPMSSAPPSVTPPVHYGPAVAVQPPSQVVVVGAPLPEKSIIEAYLLGVPLGFLGLHHFYLRRYGFGVLYFFTFGLLGMGWVADWFRMPCLVNEANRRRVATEDEDEKQLSDAYILWLPPFGLLGLHHYYLRRWGWGAAYTCTLGFFAIGWLIDVARMPSLVRGTNEEIRRRRGLVSHKEKRVCDAFALAVSPLGILGVQHYYLGRIGIGLYYTLTLGGLCVGWIVDWFRMKCLVQRINEENKDPINLKGRKYLDDAYVLAFPLGFLGLHHFYLRRPGWGVLYLFTLGCFGVGWLLDLCRMACLVSDANKRLEEEQLLAITVRGALRATPGGHVVVTQRSYVIQAQAQALPTQYPGALSAQQLTAGQPAPVDPGLYQPPSYDAAVGGEPSLQGQTNHGYQHLPGFAGHAQPLPPKGYV